MDSVISCYTDNIKSSLNSYIKATSDKLPNAFVYTILRTVDVVTQPFN